jgi:hypothetical protein
VAEKDLFELFDETTKESEDTTEETSVEAPVSQDPLLDIYDNENMDTPQRSLWQTIGAYTDVGFHTAWTQASIGLSGLMSEEDFALAEAKKGDYNFLDFVYGYVSESLNPFSNTFIARSSLVRNSPVKINFLTGEKVLSATGKKALSDSINHSDKYNADPKYKATVDEFQAQVYGDFQKRIKPKADRLQRIYNQKGYNDLNDGVVQGIASTMTFIPAAIGTIATKNPKILETYIGLQSLQAKGNSFADAINRGADYSTAVSNSNFNGLIEGVLGRVGFNPNSKFMKEFISGNEGSLKKMAKEIPLNVLTEIGAENATTLLQETSTVIHGIQSEIKIALDNLDNPDYKGPALKDLVLDYFTTTTIAAAVGSGGTIGVTGTLKYSTDQLGKLAKMGIRKGDDFVKAHNKVVTNVEKSNRVLDKFTLDQLDEKNFMEFVNNNDFVEHLANQIVEVELDTYEPTKNKIKFPRMDKPVLPKQLFQNKLDSEMLEGSEVAFAFGYDKLPINLLAPRGEGIRSMDGIISTLQEEGFLPPWNIDPNNPEPDYSEKAREILATNAPNTEYLSNRSAFEQSFDAAMMDFLKGEKEPIQPTKIRSRNRLKQNDVDESLERLSDKGIIEEDSNGVRLADSRDVPFTPLNKETSTRTLEDIQQEEVPDAFDDDQMQEAIASGELVPVITIPKRSKKNEIADDPDPINSFDYNDLSGFFNGWESISMKYADKFTHWRKIEDGLINELGFEGVEQYLRNAGIDPNTRDWRVGTQGDIFQGPVVENQKIIEADIVPKLIKHLESNKIDLDTFNHFVYNLHAPERNNYVKQDQEQELQNLEKKSPDSLRPKEKKRIEELKLKINEAKGSGITTENALDTLNEYGVEIMQDGKAVAKNDTGKALLFGYETHVKRMIDMKRDAYEKSGLVAKDLIDDWQDRYRYYVPLKGIAEDTLDGAGRKIERKQSVSGLINKQLGTPKTLEKKAKGRDSVAGDPVTQTISDVMSATIYAQKNRVYEAAGNLALAFPQSELWDVRSGANQSTWGWGENPQDPNSSQILFKSNGKSYALLIKNEKLAKPMERMDNGVTNSFLQAGRLFTRYLSYVNTSIDPEFVVNNFLRDVQTGYFNLITERDMKGGRFEGVSVLSRSDVAKEFNAKNLFKNMKRYYAYERNRNSKTPLKRDSYDYKLIEAFKKSGTQTGFLDQKSLDEREKYMRDMMDMYEGNLGAKTMKGIQAIGNWIEDSNFAVENAARITAFEIYVNAKGGLDKVTGADLDRAAALGKNLTVNFNRGGTETGVMNSLYLFFNASVQGTANVFRGATTKQKQKIFAGLFSLGSASAMYNILGSGEDEDGNLYWEKISDFDKMTGLIVMFPGVDYTNGEITFEKYGIAGRGKKYFVIDNKGKKRPIGLKIPLPYGYSFFHNMGRITTEYAMSKGLDNYDKDGGKAAIELATSLISNYSPIGFDNSENAFTNIGKTIAPDAFMIKQGVELFANEDFFGAPIYFQNFPGQNKPSSWHEKNKTSDLLESFTKEINELTGGTDFAPGVIDIDPSILQYFIDYATGGLGRTGGRVVRFITDQDRSLEQTPFARRLLVTTRDVQDSSTFFDNYTELNRIQNQYNDGRDSIQSNDEWLDKRNPWARDLINTESERKTRRFGNRSVLNRVTEKIREFKEKEDAVRTQYYKSDRDEYEKRLEALNLERNAYYRTFNKQVEEIKKSQSQ